MFDQAIADHICDRIACEPVSLQAVLRDLKAPSKSEVYRWLASVSSFRDDYARAREAQGHVDADMIADVRKQMLDGEITPEQARVAIDSLKWSAGRRLPKVYGDRAAVELTGANGAALFPVTAITVVAVAVPRQAIEHAPEPLPPLLPADTSASDHEPL